MQELDASSRRSTKRESFTEACLYLIVLTTMTVLLYSCHSQMAVHIGGVGRQQRAGQRQRVRRQLALAASRLRAQLLQPQLVLPLPLRPMTIL